MHNSLSLFNYLNYKHCLDFCINSSLPHQQIIGTASSGAVFPYFTVVLSQGITAPARYFHDCDNGKPGGNYYTKPLNFPTYYPQGHNSNDALATYKLDVLGYRVKFLQVSDINDHIVDIANSPLP
jgi:hypothetical protein